MTALFTWWWLALPSLLLPLWWHRQRQRQRQVFRWRLPNFGDKPDRKRCRSGVGVSCYCCWGWQYWLFDRSFAQFPPANVATLFFVSAAKADQA